MDVIPELKEARMEIASRCLNTLVDFFVVVEKGSFNGSSRNEYDIVDAMLDMRCKAANAIVSLSV